MDPYNQKVFSNEGYYQEEEHINSYYQEHGYPTSYYTRNSDDSQCFTVEDSYPPYPQPPQPSNEPSRLEAMFATFLASQKKMLASLERTIASRERTQAQLMETYAHMEKLQAEMAQQAIDIENLGEDKIEEELKVQKGLQGYKDFGEVFMEETKEPSRTQEDKGLERDIEEWAPVSVIEKLKEGMPIILETGYEDPFFTTSSRDKFWSFLLYFPRLFGKSSHGPLIFKGFSYLKGSCSPRKVHCRLDGRKFKWDLKVV